MSNSPVKRSLNETTPIDIRDFVKKRRTTQTPVVEETVSPQILMAIIDTETDAWIKRGGKFTDQELVEATIRLVDMTTMETVDEKTWVVRTPGFKGMNTTGRFIPQITTEEIMTTGQPWDEARSEMEDFLKHVKLLVGHNFDKFDKVVLENHGLQLNVPTLDTMVTTTSFCKIPKKRGRGWKWPRQTELADKLGVHYEIDILHRSGPDVDLLHKILVAGKSRITRWETTINRIVTPNPPTLTKVATWSENHFGLPVTPIKT